MWQFAISSQCCSLSIQICPFHPLSSHQLTPFYSHSPFFLFDSACLLLSASLSVVLSIYFYWCSLDVFLSLSFWIFFMQDISLNNFKSQSLAFAISAPILPLCASFSCFSVIFYFLSFFVSLARRLCVYMLSRDWKEAPEQKVWVYVNKNERKRECACEPHSPSLPVSAIRVSVAEWIYLLCGYWANDWCCPSKQ